MNRPIPTLFLLALAPLALTTAASAAPAPAMQVEALRVPSAEELVLRYFRPQNSDPSALTQAAEQIYGEDVMYALPDEEVSWVSHFITVGRTIVIQDTAQRAETISATLAELDRAQTDAPRTATERFEYSPRHVSMQTLTAGLESVRVESWPVSEARTLIVSGTAGPLKAAHELISRLDVPAPQVTITCHLIRATSGPSATPAHPSATGRPPMPKELVDNLQKILPMPGFEVVAVSVMQASVGSGPIELMADAADGIRYDVHLDPAAYDAQTSRLTLARCSLLLNVRKGSDQRLSTSLTLEAGEYTVLGALGSEPFFFVLRVTPR